MNNRLSFYALLTCALLLVFCSFVFMPRWKMSEEKAVIAWDASGYYWPLPAAFIYKDVRHQHFADSIIRKYRPTPDFQQAVHFEGGNPDYIFRYTFGMAVLYAPFFAAAHCVAGPLGYPADGFSPPYQFAILAGAILMALIGLWYMRRLLLYFYQDTTVAIVLLLLCLGTNYLNYAGIDSALSHSWLFTLYVLLLYHSHHFYIRSTYSRAASIGLLVGLITLVRPTDLISSIIPLLWGLNDFRPQTILERFKLLIKKWKLLLLAGSIAGTLLFLQLAYWEWATTYWVMDTYPGQGFTFSDPHFFDYIFSYRSGWATYTPMVFLFFSGFVLFLFKGHNRLPIILFSLLNLYIVVSWEQWWYSGMGGRAMVQSYSIWIFPLATLVETYRKHVITRWIFVPAALVAIYLNIWFTYQAHTPSGLYDSLFMNKSYYWSVVGRWKVPVEYEKMKDYDEFYEGLPLNLNLFYTNNFEQDTTIPKGHLAIEGKLSYVIDSEHRSSGWLKIPVPNHPAERIRAQAMFYTPQQEWTYYRWTQFMVRFYDGENVIKEKRIFVDRFLRDNAKKEIFIDVKIPQTTCDSIGISFYGEYAELPLYVDELKVWTFDEHKK
ncbi:MAG: hypothetical protein JNL72_13010 [Flavipsychrobacter sp.]|nr:hypothetical protein [Flavipsychrobacter sp.]